MTLYTTEAEREDAERLAEMCHAVHALPLPRWRSLWNSLLAIPSSRPLQVDYCWQPNLAQEIDHALRNGHVEWQSFDVIHVEHLRGVRYALFAGQLTSGNGKAVPPIIWDGVDCISLLFREAATKSQKRMGRAVRRFELKRTEKYEAWVAKQLRHILLTSPRDKEFYLSLLPAQDAVEKATSMSVVPNGVDLEYFQPGPDNMREAASLVVTGKMSYHANIAMVLHLIEDIMPQVWAYQPEVHLVIVGKDPVKEIRELAQQPQITVTGTVDDMRPYLQRAAVAIAPITYGAGIQNKVLEAMACATAVVASPIAVSAITADAGRDLLVANNPEEFARCILDLLGDPAKRSRIGLNGRQFVETNHDWVKLAASLESVYRHAVEQLK